MFLALFEFLKSATFKIIIILAILFGTNYFSYHAGINSNKVEVQKGVQAANDKVEKKNETIQTVADAVEKTQIIYKDRIVTQYQTVEKEVYVYKDSVAGHTGLDPEFVRLHDYAANPDNSSKAAEPASVPDGASTGAQDAPQVTTGEAIDVISENYKAYQLCKAQVKGWQDFYKQVQEEMNK